MGFLCVPGIGVLAYMATDATSDVRTHTRLSGLVEADRALLLSVNAVRTTRGLAQTTLMAEENPGPAIQKIESENRVEIANALTKIRATDLPERVALADAIERGQADASVQIKAIYDDAAKPKAQRSIAATTPWYNAVGRVIDDMLKASDSTGTAARMADPALADLQMFKSGAWQVRSSYGSQCSLLRPMMGSGKALEPLQQRALGDNRGVSAHSIAQLRQLAARPGVGAELSAKVGAMAASVATANAQADALIAKLGAGTGPVISGEAWQEQCTAPFNPIVAVLTQALDDMGVVTRMNANDAWTRLLVIGGLFAALIGICVFSFRGIQNRISRPLASLKQALDAMQAGDFSRAIPTPPCPDEIGSLSGALERYRENALALEASRRERDAALQDEAAAAARVSALVTEIASVVAAARAGDFSGHADAGGVDGPMRTLVDGVNEINALVDGATGEFVTALEGLAQGDLTQQVHTAYQGRFGALKDAFNDTVGRLAATMSTIQRTAIETGNAAHEINSGADDLSKRTEDQASSLEETAATTEQLAASVKASAQASQQAVSLAEGARIVAQEGGAIVTQAMAAMEGIEQASQEISNINAVIDEIAFQTNLLALNAAVEAARAGDSGRGFAVVASEVRSLAQRSSEAAKNITGLITSSNREVSRGVALVRAAGDALEKIVGASDRVARTVADISTASAEQANGIDEMSQTVAHMDEMTQQNAALAEQSAASATALAGQIQRLNSLVGAFKIDGHAPATSQPSRLRAA